MYNFLDFNCTRGNGNCEASYRATTIHTYHSLDLNSTISAPGYFSDFFNFEEGQVIIGDYLFVKAGDGEFQYLISGSSPASITPLAITYSGLKLTGVPVTNTDEDVLIINPITNLIEQRPFSSFQAPFSVDTQVTGPFGSPQNVTVGFLKEERQLTMYFSQVFSATSNPGNNIDFPLGFLNSINIFPSAVSSMPFTIYDNGIIALGFININIVGSIFINTLATTPSQGAFNGPGQSGFTDQFITIYVD